MLEFILAGHRQVATQTDKDSVGWIGRKEYFACLCLSLPGIVNHCPVDDTTVQSK